MHSLEGRLGWILFVIALGVIRWLDSSYGDWIWSLSIPDQHEGLSDAAWIWNVVSFGLITFFIWIWAGTSLPPATDIKEEMILETKASPPINGQVMVGADLAYKGAPLLETVTVRAYALEGFTGVLCFLVYIDSGPAILHWLSKNISAFPLAFFGTAALCFVFALIVGAARQTYAFRASKADALPVVDNQGRARFSYIGRYVPPFIWLHSPWFRASTWIVVAATSLSGSLVVALAMEQVTRNAFIPTFVGIMLLRWLVSSIPKRIWESRSE